MLCPQCQAKMEKIPTEYGVVDRCISCQGLWFDMLEHEDLKSYAQAIDTGNAATSGGHAKDGHIFCPVCANNPLIHMVDAVQPHIHFESCTTCYGRFYAAGEFRDAAKYGLADFIKKILAKARD